MAKPDNNRVQVYLIGKSGAGKSDFILSLIDGGQRKFIPASMTSSRILRGRRTEKHTGAWRGWEKNS